MYSFSIVPSGLRSTRLHRRDLERVQSGDDRQLPHLLEQLAARAGDRHVLVAWAHVAIGGDVAVDERPLLVVRQAEHPLRHALRVAFPAKPAATSQSTQRR